MVLPTDILLFGLFGLHLYCPSYCGLYLGPLVVISKVFLCHVTAPCLFSLHFE